MLSRDDAVALVLASPLFDERWYAAGAGTAFASREDAAAHWVAQRAPSASPHPLVEPAWLYPGGRWRRQSPDPLSHYLRHDADQDGGRSPHPRYPEAELGPLAAWLAEHDPAELLPAPVERDPVGDVVVRVRAGRLPAAVAWARHLARLASTTTDAVTGQLLTDDPVAARVLTAVTADLPAVRVGTTPLAPAGPGAVAVDVDEGIRGPRWSWLPPLLDAVRAPGVAAAQAALSADDGTVAAPLLLGHAFGDLERVDGRALDAETHPGVVARRVGATGRLVLAAHARLPGPLAAPVPAGRDAPLAVRESPSALRWSIDTAAPFMGFRWGDLHFARSLAAALKRLGQVVVLDHPESRGRATRRHDDVVLTLRGLHDVELPGHTLNLLWVIYDPDQVTASEVARYDAAFAAGPAWAAARSAEWGLPIAALPQCTDTTRFHPGLGTPGDELLFVGNTRGELRTSVSTAITTGVALTVVGSGWDDWLPAGSVRLGEDHVPNDRLGARYATAGAVLNDHWDDMRAQGFVSNRVFDVLATGGRLLTDDVVGLAELVGPDVAVWRTEDDFARLARPPWIGHPDAATRLALAERVVAEHSFDARAATLLETALRLRSRQG